MGFLDALAPYLDTAASGLVAHETGRRERAAQDQADALAALEQRARQAAAERQARLDALNEQNVRSQIATRESAERRLSLVEPPKPRTQIVDGQLVDLDAGTARPIAGYVAPPKQSSTQFTQFTGPDGRPTFFNPQTGATVSVPAGLTPPSPRTGLPTEAERKAAGLLLTGEQGYKTLEALLERNKGKEAPGLLNRGLSRVGMGVGNILSPDDLRQMDQAAYDLQEAWLRLTSGAAIGAEEIRNSARALIPQPGDDPTTLQQKAAARRLRVEALRQAAGRAVDPNVRGTADPVPNALDAQIDAILGRQP